MKRDGKVHIDGGEGMDGGNGHASAFSCFPAHWGRNDGGATPSYKPIQNTLYHSSKGDQPRKCSTPTKTSQAVRNMGKTVAPATDARTGQA